MPSSCGQVSGVMRAPAARSRRAHGRAARLRQGLLEGLPHPPPAALLAHVVLVLVAELLERRLGRRDRGIAERAERLAGDRVADAPERLEVLLAPLTLLDPA